MRDFEELFSTHYDEVVRALSLALGDRERAEDAAQEAFAKAYQRWSRVSQLDRPVAWVVVVGTNQARRWIARHDRRFRAGPATPPSVGDGTDAVVDATAIEAALATLPPRQRATVVLRYLCDLSTDQVAEALGCARGTVKSALHAALTALRVDVGASETAAHELRPTEEDRRAHR